MILIGYGGIFLPGLVLLLGSRQQGMILLQGGWPGTVKPAPAHKKAAAARPYSPPVPPVPPPSPCPAR